MRRNDAEVAKTELRMAFVAFASLRETPFRTVLALARNAHVRFSVVENLRKAELRLNFELLIVLLSLSALLSSGKLRLHCSSNLGFSLRVRVEGSSWLWHWSLAPCVLKYF